VSTTSSLLVASSSSTDPFPWKAHTEICNANSTYTVLSDIS
jgi:hypothetical protein